MTTANRLAVHALCIRKTQPTLALQLWKMAKNQLNKEVKK